MECPTRETIASFALGTLSSAKFDDVARHIEGCPACGEILAVYDSKVDDLLAQHRYGCEQELKQAIDEAVRLEPDAPADFEAHPG